MNKTFRTLWNPSLSTWVAAPETARGPARTRSVGGACAAAVAVIGLWAGPVLAAGGAGGQPDSTYYAGSGGSNGQGGGGALNDSGSQAHGGAGGSANESTSTAGANADIGGFFGAIAGAGGAAGTSPGQSGAAGESPGVANAYGGGGGAGFVGYALPSGIPSFSGVVAGGSGGNGGDGDWAAGGGGAGGYGITLFSPLSAWTLDGSIRGGAGGKGGDAWSQAGGGGSGGGGLFVSIGGAAAPLTNSASIVGGAGGAGGSEFPVGAHSNASGGGGGEGGFGVVFAGNRGTLSNNGVISGGAGGAGGAGGGERTNGTGAPGGGGDGGVGLWSQGAGLTVTNAGLITGGNGGVGGTNSNGGASGANGAGGAGVLGVNVDITNSSGGTISGGLGGDGTTRADAVHFTGGTNSLTLGGGSLVGAVAIDGAATATIRAGGANQSASSALILGGAGTFDTNGNDMTWSGAISGGAGLTKTGSGALTLGGDNTYSGGTALKQGRLNVGSNTALGTGELAMDDGTTLGFAANGLTIGNAIRLTGTQDPVIDTGAFNATVAGAITGAGFLTKEGTGALTLTGANSYTGATNVAAGTLRAGAANTFSAASAYTVAAGATLDLAGFSQTLQSVANAGTVSLVGAAPGTTLTVTGPWVGNGGTLRVGTTLGTDGSATDRLVLRGATAIASGTTGVLVTNLGGLGGQTTGNGIEIIGTENGGSIQSGAFALAAPVAAGAYQYRLDTTGTAAYLSNTITVVPPTAAQAPTSTATSTAQAVSVSTPAAVVVPLYRAEVPLFAALPAQLRQADAAMLGNMHQRIGDTDVVAGGATQPPAAGQRRAWGRVISTDMDIRQEGTVSPSSDGRLNGFQAGTDLWADGRWRAGVYAGQLDGNVDVTGFASGIGNLAVGHNDLRSQYLGVYGTYMSEAGFYADAVLQGSRHRYTVNPVSALSVDGKGSGFLASLEVGQAFAIAPGWAIEPQLQVAHRQLSLDDTVISGALVHNDGENGWLLRAGVRVKGEIATGAGMLQPYARVNVYHAASGTDVARFIGPAAFTDISSRTGYTTTEVALGATLQLSAATSVYGEVGQLFDSGGDQRLKSGVQGSVGLRVNW
ncbi:outer membrane autotransporter barrel domain-containing protein [Variovorax sp. HW608]|uniref:autotransporter outer membrane beta-barrel domain-containing protein n=1 Tax=Variovorax sp. HW608 TaxID=1034889 RepID=UPI00081FF777|nr:autotransporter outer membrane beta-barrel domain-containing protein [Variovorax sp. HW608]SCK32968.1 outer membrane autotransporter barrel domain-containing protein [Variovorax sp. HW608]